MTYALNGYKFDLENFFPRNIFDRVTEIRVTEPQVIHEEATRRVRREKLTTDGKLTILAADHPARRVTSVGDNPVAMADRFQYLGRVVRVISSEEFDGVMGPTDIIEELFIINYLVRQGGGPSFLDKKVMLGCMNRGGLSGTAFELDDRLTSFTAEAISRLRLDGAKLMVRIEDQQPASLWTIDYCVHAINRLNALHIPVFLEPLPVKFTDGKYKVQENPNDLAKIAGVASALGDSSANMWLKLPYCEEYHKVSRATTLPILMLGGEAKGDPTGTLAEFAKGMRAGANIRGALVGRNILFPGDDDPLATAMAVHRIVHNDYTAEQAVEYLMKNRDQKLDALTKYVK